MKIRRQKRRGLSLLEVLLSMAIFMIAVIGLMELVNHCGRQAFDISQVNRANQLLEDRLNAVAAGIIPLTGSGETEFDDDPNWSWSVDAESDNTPNLYRVTVTVKFNGGGNEDEWSVSRMVFDPAQKGTLEAPAATSPTTGMSGGN